MVLHLKSQSRANAALFLLYSSYLIIVRSLSLFQISDSRYGLILLVLFSFTLTKGGAVHSEGSTDIHIFAYFLLFIVKPSIEIFYSLQIIIPSLHPFFVGILILCSLSWYPKMLLSHPFLLSDKNLYNDLKTWQC